MANRIVDFAGAQPHGYVPLAVEGDGNCLFRYASVLVYGDQGNPKELRDLVMKEMKNNAEFYAAQFLEGAEKCLIRRSTC